MENKFLQVFWIGYLTDFKVVRIFKINEIDTQVDFY